MFNSSEARKAWQEFKKRNPNFEKAKGYKAGFGPALDDIEAKLKKAGELRAEWAKKLHEAKAAEAKFIETCNELESMGKIAATTLDQYHNVVTGTGDKKMLTDFQSSLAPVAKTMGGALRSKLIAEAWIQQIKG